MDILARIAAFAEANPLLMTVIVWPIVTAILNSLLRKRTEEERAELRKTSPRYAEFVRLIGALGLDPGKALEALKHLIAGTRPPPSGGATPLLVLSGAALCLSMAGCTPQARAILLETLARKIQCGVLHQDLADKDILAKCAVQEEDAKAVLDAVGTSRSVGADHAYAAANIAKKDAADKCEAAGAFKK